MIYKTEEIFMVKFLLGIFIGIIIGFIGIISIRTIKEKYELNKLLKEKGHDTLEPLVYLLIDNGIIKNKTKYLEDINNQCVYVFMENELKQYAYKNNNQDDFLEINTINIPEDITNILGDYIMWNYTYGLNSMYGRFYRFIHEKKIKEKRSNK
jgi:hypothetical protein